MAGYAYEIMREKPESLERLELRFGWGPYEIHVLNFHLTTFPAGHTIAFHKHASFEFHFIPSGKGKVVLIDQEYKLRQGQFYLTGPGIAHYQEADPNEAMDELCLHVDIIDRGYGSFGFGGYAGDEWENAEARNCVEKLGSLPLFPTEDTYQAMSCFLEAYQACIDSYPGSYTTIKQKVIQILLRAVRAYDDVNEGKGLPTKDIRVYRHRLALEFIQANYADSISLEDVAERLRISARQLQRLFHELHPGRTFSRILEDIRLQAVCRELVDGDDSIEAIAGKTGFTSGSYLHAVFRKRIGMTPSEYRIKQLQEGKSNVQNV